MSPRFHSLVTAAALVAPLALAAAPARAQSTKCPTDYPGRQHRAESLAKRGAARMAFSAAGRTVLCAIQRFELEGQFKPAEIKAAQDEMYDFLNWKLGGPAAVAAQWLTAGYQHFDRGYSDEAAAVLLGMVEFSNREPELVLPTWMLEWMKEQINDPSNADIISEFLSSEIGIEPPLSDQLAKKMLLEYSRLVPKRLVAYIPKQYDVDNREVEAFIKAKKASETTAAGTPGSTKQLPGSRLPGRKP